MGRLAEIRQEGGFTLIELLVSVSLGMVVVLATFNLLDAATRASNDTRSRVDATQRGRVAMEQITQRLRSQVCLDQNTEAIAYADSGRMDFYAELGDEAWSPEARRLEVRDADGDGDLELSEQVWTTLTYPPANTFAGAPTLKRLVLGDMGQALEDEAGTEGRAVGDPVPVFRYYTFEGDNPARPIKLLSVPLSPADKKRVVRIAVSFDSRPSRRSGVGGTPSRNRFDTTFENDVYVRTADPNDPQHSPQCL